MNKFQRNVRKRVNKFLDGIGAFTLAVEIDGNDIPFMEFTIQ